MSTELESIEIVVCLGSSCFARGNSENLETLNQYAQKHGAKVRIRLTGRLCQDQCKQGPNLMIGKELFHNVTAPRLRELLQQIYEQNRGPHGAA